MSIQVLNLEKFIILTIYNSFKEHYSVVLLRKLAIRKEHVRCQT